MYSTHSVYNETDKFSQNMYMNYIPYTSQEQNRNRLFEQKNQKLNGTKLNQLKQRDLSEGSEEVFGVQQSRNKKNQFYNEIQVSLKQKQKHLLSELLASRNQNFYDKAISMRNFSNKNYIKKGFKNEQSQAAYKIMKSQYNINIPESNGGAAERMIIDLGKDKFDDLTTFQRYHNFKQNSSRFIKKVPDLTTAKSQIQRPVKNDLRVITDTNPKFFEKKYKNSEQYMLNQNLEDKRTSQFAKNKKNSLSYKNSNLLLLSFQNQPSIFKTRDSRNDTLYHFASKAGMQLNIQQIQKLSTDNSQNLSLERTSTRQNIQNTNSTKTLDENHKSNNVADVKYYNQINDFKTDKIQKILKSKRNEDKQFNSQRTRAQLNNILNPLKPTHKIIVFEDQNIDSKLDSHCLNTSFENSLSKSSEDSHRTYDRQKLLEKFKQLKSRINRVKVFDDKARFMQTQNQFINQSQEQISNEENVYQMPQQTSKTHRGSTQNQQFRISTKVWYGLPSNQSLLNNLYNRRVFSKEEDYQRPNDELIQRLITKEDSVFL